MIYNKYFCFGKYEKMADKQFNKNKGFIALAVVAGVVGIAAGAAGGFFYAKYIAPKCPICPACPPPIIQCADLLPLDKTVVFRDPTLNYVLSTNIADGTLVKGKNSADVMDGSEATFRIQKSSAWNRVIIRWAKNGHVLTAAMDVGRFVDQVPDANCLLEPRCADGTGATVSFLCYRGTWLTIDGTFSDPATDPDASTSVFKLRWVQ
jgi:hypothetical protein